MKEIAIKNENGIKGNRYPGRGIIVGMTPDGTNMVQVYWIMGRSTNSRNRIFLKDGEYLKTQAFDESKMEDPSLIIYYPSKVYENIHIITNGDQTDTIYSYLEEGKSFKEALDTRKFEPDPPNNTPRISGITDMDNVTYKLSILKSVLNDERYSQRNYFEYEKPIAGFGHCIHTYKSDGNPIPSFDVEPYIVQLFDDIEKTLEYYWSLLDEDNKISLMVKYIDCETKEAKIKLINKNK